MINDNNQTTQSIKDDFDKNDICILHILSLIVQILVWILIIVTIICYTFVGTSTGNIFLILFILVYLIYFFLQFLSPTYKLLCNKKPIIKINEKMRMLFRAHPDISFHCECYHYVTTTYREKNSNGSIQMKTALEKAITHSENFSIPYYSSRDVSGLFYLNCDKIDLKRKVFIKLSLESEINFADEISYMDYENYKRDFINRNKSKDIHMDFFETRTVPGLNRDNLVKIGNEEPWTVNFFFYFLSVSFTLCQFYKNYVNSLFITQSFTVRKLISTRYNLNQPVYIEKYSRLVPQLDLIIQQFNYQINDYNYLNSDLIVDLPSEEELDSAKQYSNKVPNYIISNGDRNIISGVIIDNPSNDYTAQQTEASLTVNIPLSEHNMNSAINRFTHFRKPRFRQRYGRLI